MKQILIANEMVGGQNRHDGLGVALLHDGRRQPDRRGGPARRGFDQIILFGNIGHLAAHLVHLVFHRHNQDALEREQLSESIDRALKERLLAEQRQELFGFILP